MKISSEDIYSIYDIEDNAVLYKNGVIGLAFLLKLPEPNTLNEDKFDKRIEGLERALRFFGPDSFFQKQDLFLRKKVDPKDYYFHNDFISKGQAKLFDKKEYFEHTCLIIYSLSNIKSIGNELYYNPFKNHDKYNKEDVEKIKQFEENVKNSVKIINDLTETSVLEISESELKYLVYQYSNSYKEKQDITDFRFSD